MSRVRGVLQQSEPMQLSGFRFVLAVVAMIGRDPYCGKAWYEG